MRRLAFRDEIMLPREPPPGARLNLVSTDADIGEDGLAPPDSSPWGEVNSAVSLTDQRRIKSTQTTDRDVNASRPANPAL